MIDGTPDDLAAEQLLAAPLPVTQEVLGQQPGLPQNVLSKAIDGTLKGTLAVALTAQLAVTFCNIIMR